MKILDGRKIAKEKFLQLKEEVEEKKLSLSLAVVVVGEDPVSKVYVKAKKKTLEKNGITVNIYCFPENIREEDLKKEISSLKEDGVIVQLPLPENIDRESVLEVIPYKKDVDVFSRELLGDYYLNKAIAVPPVVGAVKVLIAEHNIKLKGKNVVLLGGGDLVGKPLALYFLKEEATVSTLNKHTKNIKSFMKSADVVVSGVGVSKMIKGDMIKEGVVLIDAGTSVVFGDLVGDVDTESVEGKPSYLAKVPGGVGPLTVYCLAKNLLELEKHYE